MGRHQTKYMQQFYTDYGVGPDLGNIEIKESTSKYSTFTIKNKDLSVPYILFYDHYKKIWAIVETKKLPNIEYKRSVRITQVMKLAYFIAKCPYKTMLEIHDIIDDKKLIKFTEQEIIKMKFDVINKLYIVN